ncbi:hypothetical protein [Acidithiobacillus sulfurivorans]|uniref:Uncharacterized protein n=1 Tax=Acidithiobacillus sulfurivorans TaxID=1958756 RepID=A0ABS5ZZP3_9PROT|nr:hypothetical protein [Acidithiobacillus sulfurivorans]MBU2760573.1 hypothetical protein [Acidithiobacillus sulfurivorans]
MKLLNQHQEKDITSSFSPSSPTNNNHSSHNHVSAKDWENLIAAKGNAEKADAWVRARLHEVENLSTGAQKAYLRIMTRNLP